MQVQTKKKDKIQELEQRIEQIERTIKGNQVTKNPSPINRELARINARAQTHIQKILQKTGGILAGKKINPVDWQKKIRDEWDEREKREYTV